LNKAITIVAPGRICLFGDHQDYLGLPVIACAINREVQLSSEENGTTNFLIKMPDIGSERVIPISETFEKLEKEDHLASALRVVRRYGCIPDKGFDVLLKSTIPINAGVSSSSALVVAWIHFLLIAFGCTRSITSEFIAQLAYEAEVIEHNSPGGKMDQYTISLGNIVFLNTAKDLSYKTIGTKLEGLILGESGVPKKTLGLLADVRGKAQDAIAQVEHHRSDFYLEKVTPDKVDEYSSYISEELRPYFYASIQNHAITQKALLEFGKEKLVHKTIGELMSTHHNVLKDILKITVPVIDKMITAAMEAGAFGAKIVGSGGGGSIVALAPFDKKEAIIKAIKEIGAIDAYEVSVEQGSHVL
jgi:galactokinase